jgi:hypothetical protein
MSADDPGKLTWPASHTAHRGGSKPKGLLRHAAADAFTFDDLRRRFRRLRLLLVNVVAADVDAAIRGEGIRAGPEEVDSSEAGLRAQGICLPI